MFRYTLCTVISAMIATFGLQAEDKAQVQLETVRHRFHGPSIRVQLMHDVEGALVEVKGRYNVYDPKTGKQLDTAFLPSSYYMYPTVDGIKWGAEFPGIYQILIVPDKTETTVLVAGTEYHGIVYLYQINGLLGGVNETSIDDFVTSILSTHLPDSITHKEALSAVAIALRTQVIRQMDQNSNPYWDIKAETLGYRGCSVERKDRPFVEALRNTKEMILVKGSLPVDIQWFSGQNGASGPFDQIEQMAQSGKDARVILESLFPGAIITKAKR